jgi:hypothetical protein
MAEEEMGRTCAMGTGMPAQLSTEPSRRILRVLPYGHGHTD